MSVCICAVSNQVTRVRDCGVGKTLYVPTDIGQNSCIRTDVLNNEAASRCPHDRMCSGAQAGCQKRPKNEVNYPKHAATSKCCCNVSKSQACTFPHRSHISACLCGPTNVHDAAYVQFHL